MILKPISKITITNNEVKPFKLSLVEAETGIITSSEFYYFHNAFMRARELSRVFKVNILISCELTPENSDYTGEEEEN